MQRTVTVVIDRPMGSRHPKHPDIVYPVNYGYISGVIAGDGEEQDVYVLGVSEPLAAFTGEVVAVIHRNDDVEDKWVAAPVGVRFTKHEIDEAVRFQEQYFDSWIELLLPDVTLRPLREDEFRAFKNWSLMDQVRALMDAGQHTDQSAALREATADFDSVAPKGMETPGMRCCAIEDAAYRPLGVIWAVYSDRGQAFLAEFVIAAEYRSKGYGEAALRELVAVLRADRVERIDLHVFEHNLPARRLYEKVGFVKRDAADVEAGGMYMSLTL